jgi:hypothetical protein
LNDQVGHLIKSLFHYPKLIYHAEKIYGKFNTF